MQAEKQCELVNMIRDCAYATTQDQRERLERIVAWVDAQQAELVAALRDLSDASTEAYKAGRIAAEPFVRAGNVLAGAAR